MASYFASPIGNDAPFFLSTGVPASGAKLFVYVAGSTTKQTTYTDNTGNTSNANPILLNSSGYPASGGNRVGIWIPQGVTVKFILAPSTDTDPPTSAYWTQDGFLGINDVTASQSEWVGGPTPTYVSSTSFTLVGDQSATFHVGRRLKTTNTAGTVYSTITAVAYTSLTTVTVASDGSTALDSGLSAVSYGLISANNPSVGPSETHRKGTAVASASTTDIWGIAGDFVHVTGTTTITSLGTAPYAGARREVIFDGALTLTHNSTTLVLPGAANITTAANDRMIVRADTTANMVVVDYVRANGVQIFGSGSASGTQSANTVYAGPTSGAAATPTFRALVGAESALVLLSSKTASTSASLIFGTSDFDWTLYDEYIFDFVQIVPASAGVVWQAQISEDGGSTFKGAASTYDTVYAQISGSTVTATTNTTTAMVFINDTQGTNTQGYCGSLKLFAPSSTVRKTGVIGHGGYVSNAAVFTAMLGGTVDFNADTNAINGIKFFYNSGNIASGTVRVYGLRKS